MNWRTPVLVLASALAVTTAAAAQPIADAQSRRDALRFYEDGRAYFTSEKFDRAAEEFTKATRADNLFTLAHYMLGQSYMNLQRYASAIKAYQDCLEASRRLYGLAQTNRFDVEKRRDDEIRELKDTIQRMQQSPAGNGLHLRAMQLEQHLHDLENRRTSVEPVFRAPAEVLLALGSAYFRSGNAEAAEAEWQAAVESNPRLGEAHNNLAVIYMQTGRFGDAEQQITLAEKNGFRVNPQFKADLKHRRQRPEHLFG